MSTTEYQYHPHRLDDPAFYRSEYDRIFRKEQTPAEKRAEQDTRSIEKETND